MLAKALLALPALLFLALPAVATTSRPFEWFFDAELTSANHKEGSSPSLTIPQFTLALQQNALGLQQLETHVTAASDPQSAKYGEWLTTEEVLNMVAPPSTQAAQVVEWLAAKGFDRNSIENHRDAVKVLNARAVLIEAAFNIKLGLWSHRDVSNVPILRIQPNIPFVVPAVLRALGVEQITGLSEFPPLRQRMQKSETRAVGASTPSATYGYVSPAELKAYYNVPAKAAITNKKSSQALIEFSPIGGPLFSDLQKFAQMNDIPFTNISRIIGPYYAGQMNGESTLDVEYMTAVALGGSYTYITISNGWQYDLALTLFTMEDPPLISSVSYGWPESMSCQSQITHAQCTGTSQDYVKRANAEFLKVASKGSTVIVCSQDEGAPSEMNEACQLDATDPVWPEYPASSPWVTTVSATTFVPKTTTPDSSDRDVAVSPICQGGYTCINPQNVKEVPCTVENDYYHWTTGGGFSNYSSRPSYQLIDNVIDTYLKSSSLLPPTWAFNGNNRAYPDMSGVGARILIIQNGNIMVTAGTSASTPIIAGVWALLNDARMNAGKKPLGHLNTLIYHMAATAPAAFNDITVGSNRCTINQCCQHGYGSAKGFDAVTGFGTPNYEKMLAYIHALP